MQKKKKTQKQSRIKFLKKRYQSPVQDAEKSVPLII